MTDLGVGSQLLENRYRLERRLGSGGMATVWLARDERLERPVAVKVIADTLAADETYVERFRREARIAAGLSHPNLVKVFDYAGDGERPLLVMEYVDGATLAERLRRHGPGSVDSETLARELLSALAHIHEAGIVHRDIKPENVLVGLDGRARLTDFGIARSADATRLTATGELVGTLRYIAPEVLRGAMADPRSDLFSLGMLLADCDGDSSAELRRLIAALAVEAPEARPARAQDALARLNGDRAQEATERAIRTEPLPAHDAGSPIPQTASTRVVLPTPATARLGDATAAAVRRYAPWQANRKAWSVVAAVAVLILVVSVLASAGDDGRPSPAGEPAEKPAAGSGPPIEEQLDALDRAIAAAASE